MTRHILGRASSTGPFSNESRGLRVVARRLAPRSRIGTLVIQLVLLVVVAGLAHLLVLLLGSDLQGATLQVSGVLSK